MLNIMKIFPGQNEKLITAVIFSFLFGLIGGLATKLEAKEFLTSLVTLFAAFAGAYSAFLLQNKKQEKELIASKVGSGNKAIFHIIRNYNTFGSYKKQYIAPFINDPGRFIAIPPNLGFVGHVDFDFDSLAYLFELDKPNVLGDLSIFQSEVESTIQAILYRNNLHLNAVRPALEKAGIIDGQNISKTEIDRILGERLAIMMEQNTDQMIEGVESILSKAELLIEELHRIHLKNYKGHKILKMEKLYR